jgi:hypothetical protein
MYKFISHRGNICGPDIENENSPQYIEKALLAGFDVEIDVWLENDIWFLGHDKPTHQIDLKFLKNEHFWCHAKNQVALFHMLKNNIHSFWHQEDDYTLTTKGYIWTYPNDKLELMNNSIAVMPELVPNWKLETAGGICSDYIDDYKRKYG